MVAKGAADGRKSGGKDTIEAEKGEGVGDSKEEAACGCTGTMLLT